MRTKQSTIVTFSILLTLLIGLGCSDSRRQYSADGVAPVSEPTIDPTIAPLANDKATNPDNNTVSQDEIDKDVAKNANAPITYDKGVANIGFGTTYTEALKILAKPFYGPDSRGLAAYDENIYIYWSFTKPRRPSAIFVNSGYTGKLSLPAPYGDVSVSMELPHLFNNDPRGELLIQRLYREFENADANYNCLAESKCQIDDSSEQFIQIQLPRMVLLFSKDRLSLFRIVLYPLDDPGALSNDFDLLKGQILVRDSKGLVADKISLGMSVAELQKKSAYKTEIVETSTLSFIMRFASSVYVRLTRHLDFGRSYLLPKNDEKLEALAVFGLFNKKIVLNGKSPVLTINGDDAEVKLVDKKTVSEALVAQYEAASKDVRRSEAQREQFRKHAEMLRNTHYVMAKNEMELSPSMKSTAFNAKLQKAITTKIKDLVITELKKDFPAESIVSSRMFEMHKQPVDRSFGFDVSAYDINKKTGRSVSFSLNEEAGTATYFSELINHPFDDMMMPETVKPIDVNSPGLSIFNIGQKIKLTDIDIAREEATLWIGNRKSRVSYSADGFATLKVYSPGRTPGQGRTDDKIIKLPTVGVNGVVLGLLPDGKNNSGYSAYIQTISYSNRAGIKNLCGLANTFEFGTRDRQFLADLDSALQSAGTTCQRDIPVDAKHGQRIRSIYFPRQGVMFTVRDQEISSILKYRILSLAEIKKAEAAAAANGGN